MSVTDIARDLQINRNTVSRYLDMLLISGQAEMKTYGKAKVFFPSQRVPISAMLNFSSDLVVVLDRNLIAVQVNDALCTFTGASREEIIGREVRDSHLAAFDHPLIRAKLREAMAGTEVVEELRILRVGEERYFRFKIIPTVFNDGSPGVTVILEDITDQKQSEEALREREITYRTLVEEINDVILNIDEHGIFTFISPRISDVLGYQPDEMTGSPFSGYMEPAEASRVASLILSPVPPRSFSCVECTMRARDGRPVVLEASGRPVYDEIGEFAGYRLVCRDVTERHAAVKRVSQWKSFLHSIVQNMPGIVMVRECGDEAFIFCNTAAENFFCMSMTDLAGLHVGDLFNADVTALIRKADRQALETLSPVEIGEIRVDTGDAGDRFLRLRTIPIMNARGRPKYLLTIAGDVSNQHRSPRPLPEPGTHIRRE
jgi:PAS domain S-box-containing protein